MIKVREMTQVFEGQELRHRGFVKADTGVVFENYEFRNCYFESFSLPSGTDPSLRPTIRNVQIYGCGQRGCAQGEVLGGDGSGYGRGCAGAEFGISAVGRGKRVCACR